MFTVTIKDIQVEPAIESNKVFEHTDRGELSLIVEKYIEETYPGKYNPHTLSRKISDVIKSGEGKTLLDSTTEEFDKNLNSTLSELKSIREDKDKKLEVGLDEIELRYKELKDLSYKEEELALVGLSEEEQSKVSEIYTLKREDLTWQEDKERTEYYKKINEEYADRL